MRKTRILIAGIGGVGGYFGGLLASHYHKSDEVEIIFYARGKHLQEIQNNGLKIIKGNREMTAIPKLATDKPDEIGIVDYIILCTKSYDLEDTTKQLIICQNSNTIILPLLNGVDSRARIKNIIPNNIILDGCVYIVSRLTQPGKVENIGNIETLYFGLDNFESVRLNMLESLFKQANIDAKLSKNISETIWEKYIFIAPTAAATSYYNNTIGEILEDPIKKQVIIQLIEEVKQIAIINKINISKDITELTLKKLQAMPFGATSSMHNDFKNKKPITEINSLTVFVVVESRKYQILAPTFERILQKITNI